MSVGLGKRIELEMRGRPADQISDLNLDNCRATKIEGLNSEFTNLQTLSLINLGLTTLEGFPKLGKLRKLKERNVLRREPSIPANKAMTFYFHDNAKRARGRPITTLPMTLNNDLKILQNRSISLTSQKDLETIRKIAERRQEWTTLTADIKKAAEAARSDDTPSGRP